MGAGCANALNAEKVAIRHNPAKTANPFTKISFSTIYLFSFLKPGNPATNMSCVFNRCQIPVYITGIIT